MLSFCDSRYLKVQRPDGREVSLFLHAKQSDKPFQNKVFMHFNFKRRICFVYAMSEDFHTYDGQCQLLTVAAFHTSAPIKPPRPFPTRARKKTRRQAYE